VVIEHLALTNGVSDTEGGGLSILSRDATTRATLRDLTISNNQAPGGSGIHVDTQAQVLILRCRIIDNTAPMGGGGLLVIGGSEVMLKNSQLEGNQSGDGGAVYVDTMSKFIGIGNIITGNTGTAGTGAFLVFGTVNLLDNYFERNSSTTRSIVILADGRARLVGNVFLDIGSVFHQGAFFGAAGNYPPNCDTGNC